MKFPSLVSHTFLLCFRFVMMPRFLSRAPMLLSIPPPHRPIVCPQPALQAGSLADALSGMVHSDLLLSSSSARPQPAPQAGGCGRCSLGYGNFDLLFSLLLITQAV
jgi:hypothetical protein